MTNRWLGWTLVGLVLAVSSSAAMACEKQAKDAAAAKDTTADAAKHDGAGCDMPCCAHAKDADGEKVAAKADSAETPCAGPNAKGCPKKSKKNATAAAKAEPAAEPAKDAGTAETVSNSGANR